MPIVFQKVQIYTPAVREKPVAPQPCQFLVSVAFINVHHSVGHGAVNKCGFNLHFLGD